jgi:5-methylcytosine-specific restriction endonuclease McrA
MSSLNRPVLVFNKKWEAVSVATVRRCLNVLCAGKAFIVEHSKESDLPIYTTYRWDEWININASKEKYVIKTSRSDIRIPEVIILGKSEKTYYRDLSPTHRNIYLRDKYVCQYTGKKLKKEEASIDHVHPKARGGKNTWDNLVVCSKSINSKKGNMTIEEAGLKLIKEPSKPKNLGIYRKIGYSGRILDSWNLFVGEP